MARSDAPAHQSPGAGENAPKFSLSAKKILCIAATTMVWRAILSVALHAPLLAPPRCAAAMMAKADVSGRADTAVILAAAQRSRAREQQSALRSSSREASLPGCQTGGVIPDDVFRPVAVEHALIEELQAIEDGRERERAIWSASSPLAFASERRALSRQSRPLTARQCGPPAMHAVRTAASKAAVEYLAFVSDLGEALDYCHGAGMPGQAAALARPTAARFGPRALMRRVGELLETVGSPIYVTAAGHLPTVWSLFSEVVISELRERHGPRWRAAEAARLLRALHQQARAEMRLLHAGQPRRVALGGPAAPPRQADRPRPRVERGGSGAESPRTPRRRVAEARGMGFGLARRRD